MCFFNQAQVQGFEWRQVTKGNEDAWLLADRHYSRRKFGAPQFMPPGEAVVLLSVCRRAVFGWWRPHPRSGISSWNKLDGWTCTIFRNESNTLSSVLILQAEQFLLMLGKTVGPDGFLTYVWDSKVRSTNPGYCFKVAGWQAIGRSADNQKTLLQKRKV